MKKPMLVGKLTQWNICHCHICDIDARDGYSQYNAFETRWLCKRCTKKMKYKPSDKVYCIKWNRTLGKLQIVKGIVEAYSNNREMTYRISYANGEKSVDARENYIFSSKRECLKVAKKLGEVADDKLIRDTEVMKLQGRIYNEIKKFLDNDLAREFNIIGIDVTLENGYVNAMWKFEKGKRKKNDIKE